jgi:protein tyrosine phosphatase (PTP) superfamily phosphohydrolase (DUF442 family)
MVGLTMRILAFLELSERLATAGQPTEEELAAVAAARYEVVINLAQPTSTGALDDEAASVARLGLDYLALPIDFEKPDVETALRFFAALDRHRERKLFVHCAANMRVSALMFAYRVARGLMSREDAGDDLELIWVPNPTWARYIEDVIAAAKAESTTGAPR